MLENRVTITDLKPLATVANDVELVTLTVDEREVPFIDSRDVAEMIEMRHTDLLRKIDEINIDFENAKLRSQKYWIESTYKTDGNNKTYKCYLITKRGCEFLAHKTTGTKGNLFTDRYMDVFEKMEQTIKNKQDEFYNNLSTEMKSILLLDTRTQELDKKISNVAEDFNYFKDNETLSPAMMKEISQKVKRIGIKVLGGKESRAYKISNKHYPKVVMRDIYNQLKREFGIDARTSYMFIKRKDLQDAMDFLDTYKLPARLEEEIRDINTQLELEV